MSVDASPGSITPPTPRSAYVLGTIGGALGVTVGTVELAFGSSIRSWVGNKYDTVGLGAATIALATIAFATATLLRHPPSTPARRFAVALALIVCGGICFTTAGRLWWLPGSLICGAGLLTMWSLRSVAGAIRDTVVERWLHMLLFVVGGYLVALGATVVDSRHWVGGLGLAGGLAVAGLAVADRHLPRHWVPAGVALAVTPVVALTWWSLITPVIALAAVALAAGADRRPGDPSRAVAHGPDGVDVLATTSRTVELCRS